MKWSIKGLDATTGADRVLEVTADSQEEAAALAGAQGIAPHLIAPVAQPPPFPVHPTSPPPLPLPSAPPDPDAPVRCPRCGSSQVAANKKGFGLGKAVAGGVLLGPFGLLGGVIGSGKMKITCLKCGTIFAPGEGK